MRGEIKAMKRTRIAELFIDAEAFAHQEVTLGGWVRSLRDLKNFGFIELHDGSCFASVQVVFAAELDNYKEITQQNAGAALIVRGRLLLTPLAKQPFEIQAAAIEVAGASAPDYPLQKKRHTQEFLRTIAHLRPRTNLFNAVFRLRSLTSHLLHCFFQERGFIYIQTPIITCSDAEGAGEMFRVTTLSPQSPPTAEDFFGRPAHLTVSGQLNAESFALAFSDVYTFGPTFRAENSNTPRHAAEFWMLEPEIAFADLGDIMRLAEDLLKYVLAAVLDKCQAELDFLNQYVDTGLLARLRAVLAVDFAAVTYTEAITILTDSGTAFNYPVSWGCDLQTEHERYLSEQHFGKPVFVTDYPKEIKAFYMRLNDDAKTVAAMDLLVPGVGELIGGSQREERQEFLMARMAELGLDQDTYRWYLELRKFGGTRHAGFGLGFERLLMYMTGVANIRDVIPFPRTAGNAEF
jgi:asparaginyl-tRNA synthetase